jgi:hypothetical protein
MFAKLSFMLGHGVADARAAGDHLHSQFGVRDPLALNDRQAEQFAKSVREKYGSFRVKTKPGEQAEDRYERPVPSRDGSRKAKLNPQEIYERYNRVKAGVPLANVSDDDELQTTNGPALEDPEKQKRRKKTKTIDDVSREYWERNRK